MASKKKNKVVPFRKYSRIPVVFMAVLAIYLVYFVILYFTRQKVQTYEVQTGSLMNNATFTGVAIRDEKVYYSEYSGNINYYKREATRAMVDDTIYSVDETGRVAEILANYSSGEDNSLSDDNLNEIKTMLVNYKKDYQDGNFKSVYDLKSDLNAMVLEFINANISENLDSIVESTGSTNLFRTIKASNPGVVVYATDGYENIGVTNISSVDFDKTHYQKNVLKTGALVAKGDPAYKLISNEEWYIMFPLTSSDISKYNLSSKTKLDIKFKKDNIEESFPFKIVNTDGGTYGMITLNKYMIRYATERFLDFEIVESGDSGIKVPVSAVTEQEFYKIPREYLVSSTSSNTGFNVESSSGGTTSVTYCDADIYKSTDDYVYVNINDFSENTCLVKPDSNERFYISEKEKLKGVYCINSGYTVFKLVEIIDSNKEYYICKKSLSHGVSLYDRIMLDADKYEENQMIY